MVINHLLNGMILQVGINQHHNTYVSQIIAADFSNTVTTANTERLWCLCLGGIFPGWRNPVTSGEKGVGARKSQMELQEKFQFHTKIWETKAQLWGTHVMWFSFI